MRLRIALLAATLASPAWAQQPPATDESARETPKPHADDDNMKGYGYGTQPGQESNAGARQSSSAGREKSAAPQDERGAAASRAGEREGSSAGSSGRKSTSATHHHKAKKKAGHAAAPSTDRDPDAARHPSGAAEHRSDSGEQRSDTGGVTAEPSRR